MSSDDGRYTSLAALLAAPKGVTQYIAGEAFLLHVFWEAPDASKANQLLDALSGCATATHRDTPCVPTYFFRLSSICDDLTSPARKAGEHPQLIEIHKKLKLGVPAPAVRSSLAKLGLDPALADLSPEADLPLSLQNKQPVFAEFTEIYLDARAFYEHAGSRDYLDSYGKVMDPALIWKTPQTVRLGNAPVDIAEKILEPQLKEIVCPVEEGFHVWKAENAGKARSDSVPVFLSLDFPDGQLFPSASTSLEPLRRVCTTLVTFPHPLRESTTRLMCVFADLPLSTDLKCLLQLKPVRGEAHLNGSEEGAERLKGELGGAGLGGLVEVNANRGVGYVLHEKARELTVKA